MIRVTYNQYFVNLEGIVVDSNGGLIQEFSTCREVLNWLKCVRTSRSGDSVLIGITGYEETNNES